MYRLLDNAFTIAVPIIILVHLSVAPFTKVEESFNIQAIQDIQAYGLPFSLSSLLSRSNNRYASIINQYDHVEFPGSVPRTFVGAIFVAAASNPFLKYFADPLVRQQLVLMSWLVRLILGLFTTKALLDLRKAVTQSFGRTAGNWFILLQASQFHVMYYASRTLPNIYAFSLTTLSLRSYVLALNESSSSPGAQSSHMMSLFLLTVAGIIFRAEIAVLLAAQTLFILFTKRASLTASVIPAGLLGVPFGLALTVGLDSIFWQQFPTWPEWTSFYYNTVEGQASNWGISPWHYYISSALPKLLMSSIILLPLALLNPSLRSRVTPLIVPSSVFVVLYSFLPHKEWRFVMYTVPAYTTAAATAASWIWTRRSKNAFYRLSSLALIALVALNLAISGASLLTSSLNYPGGAAVVRLRHLVWNKNATVSVFADNLTCQTGLTRYLEQRPMSTHKNVREDFTLGSNRNSNTTIQFTKSEDQAELLDPKFWTQFDYALAEDPARCIGAWDVVDVVYGFAGLKLSRGENSQPLSGAEEVEEAEAVNMGKRDLYLQIPLLDQAERLGSRLTGGYWPRIKLAPRVHILKRQEKIGGHANVKIAATKPELLL